MGGKAVTPDLERWTRVAAEPSPWLGRLRFMAGRISEGARVLDVGAGSRELRQWLPITCSYTAIDCVPSHPETIVLDLDTAESIPCEADVAVMAGVLEYLAHPIHALDTLAWAASRLLVSYQPAKLGEDARSEANGWVNHFYEPELVMMLAAFGPNPKRAGEVDGHAIYEVESVRL